MAYKGCKEVFFHEETSLPQLQTAHALFKVRQYSFLMPENPIHPGCNSTNTNKLLLEKNLVQRALKSCLIYTFQFGFKAMGPTTFPQDQMPLCWLPQQSTEGDGWKLFPFPDVLPLLLQKMWHQPGYDNNVTHPAVMCVPSFGQAFSEITLPSRKLYFFLITRWQFLGPFSTVLHCPMCKGAFL